uniref:Phospholipid/glycerol acyltransferase domain-containing protein n=1 Tax=Kalanchoe fedtschenkoi TaxID=63787 RepID=A0A7N0UPN6_KALFE
MYMNQIFFMSVISPMIANRDNCNFLISTCCITRVSSTTVSASCSLVFCNCNHSAGIVTERVREAHENKDAPMMMLFPEGTTTNGDYLLPFKTGAFLSKTPVLPVILRYPYQRLSPAWDSISGVSAYAVWNFSWHQVNCKY